MQREQETEIQKRAETCGKRELNLGKQTVNYCAFECGGSVL